MGGVLPAYAGMILFLSWPSLKRAGAPRVCGDDPRGGDGAERREECSPRMRG